MSGEVGQSSGCQIDCLADIGKFLGNIDNRLWHMMNGYALASRSGLIDIRSKINVSSESEIAQLRGLLRIGIQWSTEVTLSDLKHTVSQSYCSALPVAYSQMSPDNRNVESNQ